MNETSRRVYCSKDYWRGMGIKNGTSRPSFWHYPDIRVRPIVSDNATHTSRTDKARTIFENQQSPRRKAIQQPDRVPQSGIARCDPTSWIPGKERNRSILPTSQLFSGVSYSSHSLHSSGQVGKQAYHVLSREPPYLHEAGVRLRDHSLPQTTSHRA